MAIVYNNKEYRNLQQQVKKNMDDILFILQEEGVLNEFGIKVVGQEASVIDMPTVDDYKTDNPEWSYGDAFAIGTEEPYELYILTRANGTHPDDYWFNIGEFPAPGPQGPEGPQGEVGPQGPTGNPGANGISPQLGVGNVVVETLESDQDATVAITESGTQANPIWNFNFGIPKGQDGSAITAVEWGNITGELANQTDLLSALQAKANASALASYATQVYANNVASNATYQANVYTDSQISALSSVYMTELAVYDYLTDNEYAHIDEIPTDTSDLTNNAGFITNTALSGYATQSWVSSAISSLTIPSITASYSGSYWTEMTLDGVTKEFGAGGGQKPSVGDFTAGPGIAIDEDLAHNTVSIEVDQATIPFKVDLASVAFTGNYNDLSNKPVIPDITGLASVTYVDNSIAALSSVYATKSEIPSLSGYATESWVTSQGYLTSVPSEYATISQVSSAINSLDYASVHALSENTVIPDITGLATEQYVDNSINDLSSVYAPIGDYVTHDDLSFEINEVNSTISSLNYASVGALSSATVIPDITGLASETYVDNSINALSSIYAPLSGSNTFTGFNRFSSSTLFNGWTYFNSNVFLGQNTYQIPQVFVNASTFSINASTSTSFYGHVRFSSNATFMSSVAFGGGAIYNGSTITNGLRLSLPNQSGTLALISDIPVVSEYATVSALSSAIDGLSSVYAPLSDYASQSWVSANFLSSGYVPTVSGYAELSGSNIFTGYNTFSSLVVFTTSNGASGGRIEALGGDLLRIRGGSSVTGGNIQLGNNTFIATQSYATFKGSVRFETNEIYGGGSDFLTANVYSLPSQSGSLALLTDIPTRTVLWSRTANSGTSLSGIQEINLSDSVTNYDELVIYWNNNDTTIEKFTTIFPSPAVGDKIWMGGNNANNTPRSYLKLTAYDITASNKLVFNHYTQTRWGNNEATTLNRYTDQCGCRPFKIIGVKYQS